MFLNKKSKSLHIANIFCINIKFYGKNIQEVIKKSIYMQKVSKTLEYPKDLRDLGLCSI